MKSKILLWFYPLMCMMILTSCKDDIETEEQKSITILDPSDKTETQFRANWTTTPATISSVDIELATDNSFGNVVKTIKVADAGESNCLVEDLYGATKYYYRIKVLFSDGESLMSATASVITRYQSEEADVISSDGLHIAGDMYYLSSNPANSPAMILMGHFSINNMWKGEELFLNLVAQGYVCYIFNVRGHGASDGWPIFEIVSVEGLAEFVREYASLDLKACYDYLRTDEKVDPDRIGLMGGSMGANLSMIGNDWEGVVVSVGLTNSRVGLEDIGILKNVLFVVANQDCIEYFCYLDEVEHLYNSAAEPKKKFIIDGEFHGLDMFVNPDVKPVILDWINARMGV